MPKATKARKKKASAKKKPDATAVLGGILAACSLNVGARGEGGVVVRLLSGNGSCIAEARGSEPLPAVCNLAEVVAGTWEGRQ